MNARGGQFGVDNHCAVHETGCDYHCGVLETDSAWRVLDLNVRLEVDRQGWQIHECPCQSVLLVVITTVRCS